MKTNVFRWLREPFEDTRRRTSSSGTTFEPLDGFRGLAVLVVLSDHTGFLSNVGRGYVGVGMFFVLSGFLLTMPFNQLNKIVSLNWSFCKDFLMRRIRRIYPLYIFFIFMMFYPLEGVIRQPVVFVDAWQRFKFFLGYALFLISGGHLWTVTEEVYFYAILPLVFWINLYVLRGRKLLIVTFLIAISCLWAANREAVSWLYVRFNREFGLNGKSIYFDIFLLGVAASYLMPALTNWTKPRPRLANWFTAVSGSLLTLFLMLGNGDFLAEYISPLSKPFSEFILLGNRFLSVGFISAFLILALVISPRGALAKFYMFFPLRLIGVLGYSMYLVHPHVLAFMEVHGVSISRHAHGRFMIVLVLSLIISCMTYTYIEKPLMKKSGFTALLNRFFRWRHRTE